MTTDEPPWPQSLRISRTVTPDAVVIIPGIMGSELRDTATDTVIWGLRDLKWYVKAWSKGTGLDALQVTDAEREGRTGRVKATGLLEFPAFAPLLAGFEPYTRLVRAIKDVVASPAAVLEFAYDWRLSVAHNADLLAKAAAAHLAAWQALSGRDDARLVLVAHSMGGLLCRALSDESLSDIRAVVTLGTPFDGAAKAAVLLGSGSGTPLPLPRDRLRTAAATMPGIYELLPSYQCVDDGDSVRVLTPNDVSSFGGDADLASAAFTHRGTLNTTVLPGHRALLGVEQPTISSLTLANGVVTGQPYTFALHSDGEFIRHANGVLDRQHGLGDGTVPRNSALPYHSTTPAPIAQQHGTLAHSAEAITFVVDVLLHGDASIQPRLSTVDIGIALPDVVAPEEEWVATITGTKTAGQVRAAIFDAETGIPVRPPLVHRRDETLAFVATLGQPGIYRVEISVANRVPVSQLVMVEEP